MPKLQTEAPKKLIHFHFLRLLISQCSHIELINVKEIKKY